MAYAPRMTKQTNTRLWQKLVEAIHGSVYVDTPENTGGALVAILTGLREDGDGAEYLKDERATHALETIRPFLEASASDETQATSSGAPPLVMRAKRLTADEKRTLGVAVWDLFNALNNGT